MRWTCLSPISIKLIERTLTKILRKVNRSSVKRGELLLAAQMKTTTLRTPRTIFRKTSYLESVCIGRMTRSRVQPFHDSLNHLPSSTTLCYTLVLTKLIFRTTWRTKTWRRYHKTAMELEKYGTTFVLLIGMVWEYSGYGDFLAEGFERAWRRHNASAGHNIIHIQSYIAAKARGIGQGYKDLVERMSLCWLNTRSIRRWVQCRLQRCKNNKLCKLLLDIF